jgi:16S rRNA (cytosine1402-N4)-methyltransferase
MHYHHVPVMVEEALYYLDCKPGQTVVDGTLGGGGHTKAILRQIEPNGFLVGVDKDPDAIASARKSLRGFTSRLRLVHTDFADIRRIRTELGESKANGILLDLGLSLYHLEGSGRGFSFKRDEPLDMRMNPKEDMTAQEVVNQFTQDRLTKIISDYGEERWAGRIAAFIVKTRRKEPIASSMALTENKKKAIPARHQSPRIHPATRTFQAIRIAVNRELESLRRFLHGAPELLTPGGRLCIISFHSLEDRIVKQRFKEMADPCRCPPEFPVCTCGKKPQVRILTKKPARPNPDAVNVNPLARSAKLRAVEKLPGE